MSIKRPLGCAISLFVVCLSLEAQICNTPSSPPPAWLFNPLIRLSQVSSPSYTLRVFVHIIRSNNGTGLGQGIVNTMLYRLNSDYSHTGIQFQSVGVDFIDNNAFYNQLTTDMQCEALYATNAHDNAIDIYVLGTYTNTYSVFGRASSIPSTALWIHGSVYSTSVLSHEMGHCLGLYHTHHGTVDEVGDSQQCREHVNGSNATTCGDYISDTPADPNRWNGCNYAGGNLRDDNNQLYSPNPSNYMAYSAYTCWTIFTPMQIQRIQDFIINTPMLQNVVIPAISGPDIVCSSGATFSIVNLPQGASVSWSASAGLTLSFRSGTSITVCAASSISGREAVLTAVLCLAGDTIAELQKKLWVGTPVIDESVYPMRQPQGLSWCI